MSALERLRAHLERDWEDGDRISVVVNPPPTPRKPTKSMLPPSLAQAPPMPRWVTIITFVAATIAGAVFGTLKLIELLAG